MKDIRKLPHRRALGLIPEELLEKTIRCPLCNMENAVPWLEEMVFPAQPVKPNSGVGHWVPVGMPMTCSCNHKFIADVAILPNEGRWALYGDEAGRYIAAPSSTYSNQALNYFCITLVSLHQRRQDQVRGDIYNLKKSIAPTEAPEAWSHHFTEIWRDSPTSGRFELQGKVAKIEYAKKFAKVIREARPELTFFNISSCIVVPREAKERKLHIRQQKEDVFSQSILATLQVFREQNKAVNWIFDNVKDTTSGARTEGWAAECFLGLQYTRLFIWLSAGATVTPPNFVSPGSHFLLEVADFISYCVARDFEKSTLGENSEFPSSLLGPGFFQGTLGCGSVESIWSQGLPLQKIYGLKDVATQV